MSTDNMLGTMFQDSVPVESGFSFRLKTGFTLTKESSDKANNGFCHCLWIWPLYVSLHWILRLRI